MNTRRVIIIFAAFALIVSATALWDASGDEHEGDGCFTRGQRPSPVARSGERP